MGSSGAKQGFFMGAGFALALIGIIVVASFFGLSQFPTAPSGGEKPAEPTGYALQLPIKITVRNAVNGSLISTGTVYVLDSEYNILETVSISNGVGTTAVAYQSGESLYLFFTASGYGAAAKQYTVPYAASEAQDYYYAAIDVYDFPTDAQLSLSLMDELGNQVATETSQSGASFDSDGKCELTLHMVLDEDLGIVSYFDPIEDENDDFLVVFILNDTLPTISSSGLQLERLEYGDNVYYVAKLSDLIATRDDSAIRDIGFTVYYSGSSVIGLTVKVLTMTDYNTFKSSLAVDSDGLEDSVYTLAIS